MKRICNSGRWLSMVIVAALLLATPACQRHPYRIPDPKGPPIAKVKRNRTPGNEAADGRVLDVEREAVKMPKNRLDKQGLVKKPKHDQRRLKPRHERRRFLGISMPF
ncbi:hypothetical protein D0N36_01960 [Hymenobacter lapidiphilus]|uniref:hypothetical protein n=1 Tax=Hymenobacter sp. CCM 8763 TaxID=2303334 RepID=UPI000E341A4E|nr:hypothetical protein [Hymenobacter sp. CCM 8763]RFP66874.1 hypothetical protein D0N36_01960 [Hymenobacter sp. CCM 8763]